MNKPKVGDKLYHLYCSDKKIYIEEAEITYIEDDIYCLSKEDSVMTYTTVMYDKNKDYFVGDCYTIIYYKTREQALQKAIEENKNYIKNCETDIEKHKQILKDLENEISRNK